jgi:predicted nucleic-acid-binding Zn-ribbon protein
VGASGTRTRWRIFSRQRFFGGVCSREHESGFIAFLGACVAQNNWATSADGVEFMDQTPKTLIAALQSIREMATNALNRIAPSQEEHSMRWKCKRCQYVKHFTNPVSLETVGRCPRCKNTEFRPLL